ncbi:glycosyltransferase family 2 protein [Kineococcus sp. SYSU DK001]|uniref:glycosyltransferase family 2 protein n=1 Tax=Kineococcus sp. SYSU DK001 TaxID=3383122 RepID=UPI003D7E86EF
MRLLSACVITRDEGDRLRASVDAVSPFVDEVVVHDTGSSDGSPDIARTAGCRVVEGTWADDFAGARNIALDHATGEWVLSVDTDEVCAGDPQAFRSWLVGVREPVLAVTLRNTGAGAAAGFDGGYEFTAVRLFRRSGARWSGRVHERVVRNGGRDDHDGVVRLVPPALLHLQHSGYAEPGAIRRKAERNGRLAAMELDDLLAAAVPPSELARTALKVGRSAIGAQDAQRAVDAFEAVRELQPAGRVWAEATDFLIRVLLAEGRPDIALVLVEQLRAAGERLDYCRWLQAQSLAQMRRPAEALEELRGVREIVDTAGRRHDPAALDVLRMLCSELLEASRS